MQKHVLPREAIVGDGGRGTFSNSQALGINIMGVNKRWYGNGQYYANVTGRKGWVKGPALNHRVVIKSLIRPSPQVSLVPRVKG